LQVNPCTVTLSVIANGGIPATNSVPLMSLMGYQENIGITNSK
jgi:hypothetical protein